MVIVLRLVLFVFGVAAILLAASAPRPTDADGHAHGVDYAWAYSIIGALCFVGVIVSTL